MKRLDLVTVAAILLCAASVRAQTNTFHVAITGTVTVDAGKLKITSTDLLTSTNNALVLVYDQTDDFILLLEENTNSTLAANVLMGDTHSARLVNGTFDAGMEAYGGGLAGVAVTNLPPPTPVFNGDVQMIWQIDHQRQQDDPERHHAGRVDRPSFRSQRPTSRAVQGHHQIPRLRPVAGVFLKAALASYWMSGLGFGSAHPL